jgi:hypothetical protein
MHCDQCGCTFHAGEDSLVTTVAVQIGGAGEGGARTEIRPLALCDRCAAGRRKTQRFFIWTFLLLVGGMTLAAIWAAIMGN